MRNFRELETWKKAHSLALAVYQATCGFPRDELYGLSSQLRRASASIPTNIAEGCGRDGRTELARFCFIASGSASELEYLLLLSRDLKLLSNPDYDRLHNQVVEVKRMLASFIRKLKADG